MQEVLINKYLKVAPVEHESFVPSDTYEEIGVVVAKDPTVTDIPIGSKVFFDSFMAKKYPVTGKEGEYQYFIHYGEIVKFEHAE